MESRMSTLRGTTGEPCDGPCNGRGWIKNKENAEGFFACRGCVNCGTRRVTIPNVVIVEDDGTRRPVEIVCVEPQHKHNACPAKEECPVPEPMPRIPLPPLTRKPLAALTKKPLPPLKKRGA